MNYSHDQIVLQWLLRIYAALLERAYGLQTKKQIGDIRMHYILKNDNPDVGYKVELGDVTDAEGEVITDPQGLTVQVVSSDSGVVSINGGEAEGQVSFGHSGTAAVTVEVRNANGDVLASGGDTFTLTTGDPKAVTSVKTSFEGLVPADETPAPEPVPPAPIETPVETPIETTPPENPAPVEPAPETPVDPAPPTEPVQPTEPVNPDQPSGGGFQ